MIQIASLDPILGKTPLPVNTAIAKAFEKYSLLFQINSSYFFSPQPSVPQKDPHERKEINKEENSRSKN